MVSIPIIPTSVRIGMLTCLFLATSCPIINLPCSTPRVCCYFTPSSAKDQLSGTSVAVKKIMKPFSTPVLSKRTYRELKLLKHLKHENVSY